MLSLVGWVVGWLVGGGGNIVHYLKLLILLCFIFLVLVFIFFFFFSGKLIPKPPPFNLHKA
jgi:hypothetical protein